MRTDWKIEKIKGAPRAKAWALRYRPAGYGWETMSHYPTRKAALTMAYIMRERGDPISWEGGPIRLGVILVDAARLKGE